MNESNKRIQGKKSTIKNVKKQFIFRLGYYVTYMANDNDISTSNLQRVENCVFIRGSPDTL